MNCKEKKKKTLGCQMLLLKQIRTPGNVGLILIRAGLSKEGMLRNETEKKKKIKLKKCQLIKTRKRNEPQRPYYWLYLSMYKADPDRTVVVTIADTHLKPNRTVTGQKGEREQGDEKVESPPSNSSCSRCKMIISRSERTIGHQ